MKKCLFLGLCLVAVLALAADRPATQPPERSTPTAPGPFQFHAAGGEIYVFEPGTGRVWKQFQGSFFKPLAYQTGAGAHIQFTPPTVAQELEEFRKQSK